MLQGVLLCAMHTEVLIIGQGLSGTFLSFYLQQQGTGFLVIDTAAANSASRVAAGIINPVTGRRLVTVWKDTEIIPFAEKAYREIGNLLQVAPIIKTAVVDIFPNPFMKESFEKRMEENAAYLQRGALDTLDNHFDMPFGYGLIEPAFVVHPSQLLDAWRQYLVHQQKLIQEDFDYTALTVSDTGIHYKDITADRIIFCDGVSSAVSNPFFTLLPFAVNKGEVLHIRAPQIPADKVYKKSLMLIPQPDQQTFWVGSNYTWNPQDDLPTASFQLQTIAQLQHWLKGSFEVLQHKAALRPATVERRPFVGFHPLYKNVGILNGMGSKGCSLAPYYACQLAGFIKEGKPVDPEADIHRFARILSK